MSSARELLVGPPGTAVSLNVTRHESLFGIDAVKVRLSTHHQNHKLRHHHRHHQHGAHAIIPRARILLASRMVF